MGSVPLWQPSAERVASTRLTAFVRAAEARTGRSLAAYADLHRFSVEDPEAFWPLVWDVCGIEAADRGRIVVQDRDRMPGARFFPDARLNFAENLLRSPDDRPAIVFWGETRVRRILTRAELYAEVSRLAQALASFGIGPGDRVAGYLPNMPEAVVAMLAAASLGAVWSSCSPDFGVQGVLDRFGQIEPRVLVSADGYFYNGRRHDSLERLDGIMAGLPTVEHTIVVPYVGADPGRRPRGTRLWAEVVEPYRAAPMRFEPFPFNHPLYILYSSGTTGAPKCIVHGAGGTLIQHLKEHQLHCDIRPGDRVFYYTTCGWMMWNWLVSALASEATILLYDGSPFHPDGRVLFDFADATDMTLFGTSAKYIGAVEKAGLAPMASHRLASLRTMTSTGSPLPPESFDFVYRSIKADLHLASISGGTDIVSCFVGGNPNGPVWRGEIQVRGLGMDVHVFDDEGRSVRGQPGELVCVRPFPSMPLGFWKDEGDRKYRAAYFERFPGVWCHGDWAEITEHDGIVIHGRSDAVLNPGGVRIGTAEIYRQVDQLDEVVESLVVGQRRDHDERIVLFVRLRDDVVLDETLQAKIREHIRRNTTPRHVPARIVQVPDIPRTRSGKIVELAVRDVIHGREVRNREALANPEALEFFRDLPALKD
jgi:acetoacetyl-CoA synthetase